METKETNGVNETKESKKSEGFKIRPLHIFAIIALVLIAGVFYMAINNAAAPVVSAGDTINVSYTGTFANGTVFDTNVGKQPLQFTVGTGQLIKGFDEGVVGMHLNEEKTITIPANEAYGEVNPALFVQVPTNAFKNQTMQVGMIVGRTANGQQEQGVVSAVNASVVTVNFNPPLAGHTLIFTIKVLSIHKG
jgi:FKBP-type peptidyl-prolyl cis-trans isomerase 2